MLYLCCTFSIVAESHHHSQLKKGGNFKMKYFTDNDLDKLVYFQVPKVLIIGDNYKAMKPSTKMLYIVLLDRMKLSMQNGWKDDGRYYVRMSAQKAADLLGFSESTFKRAKKELNQLNLLEEKQEGLTKTNKLFIGQLNYTDDDVYKLNHEVDDIMIEAEEHAQTVDTTLKCQNDPSRSVKMTSHEGSKRTTNKNDFTKNNLSNPLLSIDNYQEAEKSLERIFTDTCNEMYASFAVGRWSKKQWNVIVKKFVTETIEAGRHKSIPPHKVKGYCYKALETIALNSNDKRDKLDRFEMYAESEAKAEIETAIQHTAASTEMKKVKPVPLYNWLEERE